MKVALLRALLAAGVMLAGMTPAQAASIPTQCGADARIRCVDYDPTDVVSLNVVAGIGILIVFEEGEEFRDHGFGDSSAYFFTPKGNALYLKARLTDANTNVNIRTTRRSYSFDLKYHGTNDKYAVHKLFFRYPDTKTAQEQSAQKARAIDEAFASRREGFNLQYTVSGDAQIGPTHAWDNGERTCFKFASNQDLPSITVVNAAGQETLVDAITNDPARNTVCAYRVAKKWIIRLGDAAAAVHNENYDPVGVENTSRTISPDVVRTLPKGNK
ncbi:TrbG/VirB9 family P-type conjugative transfer protein [Achromobacter ruhlandii]|uniref:TrbG/VirB9 family P-type conjugative transfer protein n=1 Tax=Achromobacter ruhlandii TaxID=72557 RepID=UPI003BA3A82A